MKYITLLLVLLAINNIYCSTFCGYGTYSYSTYYYYNCETFNTTYGTFANAFTLENSSDGKSLIKNVLDLKIGDKVLSIGGVYATVTSIKYTTLFNPQIYYRTDDIELNRLGETTTYEASLLLRSESVFTDATPYAMNRMYTSSSSSSESSYQYGLVNYVPYLSPEINVTETTTQCQYCDGTTSTFPTYTYSSIFTSDIRDMEILNVITEGNFIGNGCQSYPSIIIEDCEAVILETDTRFIVINGIAFAT